MSKRDDKAYIEHIRSAADSIQSYVRGMTFEAFAADRKTQHAVLYEIAVIGEAAGSLSERFQAEHPEVPWRDIIGMRNVVIHEYFGVDIEEVWRTATQDVPHLLASLSSM
jgi:uncharacterized protein with HEPN domain